MINRTILVGRLTKDLELRYTSGGKAVASGTIAVNRPFKGQNGENEADFIQIVIWVRPAENSANFVGKGSLVGIDGRIQTRSYDNNEGKRIYITEVVADSVQFLEPKKDKSSNQVSSNPSDYDPNYNDPFAQDSTPVDIDDGLPF